MYKKYQAFCEYCWKDVDYYLEDYIKASQKFGKIYEHPAKAVYCVHCNQRASHLALIDYNVLSLSKKYREEHNLLGYAEICEIASIYNIGEGPLAKLLEHENLYYLEYFDGIEPSHERSQKLSKLRYEPQYFLEILEANKDKVSPISYAKAQFAAQCLLENSVKSKLYYACLYFIHKKYAINKQVLQKLLFYTQGFNRIIFGYPLFTQECFAGNDGPIFEVAHNALKDKSIDSNSFSLNDFREELPEHFSHVFLDHELELLDTIAKSFGSFTYAELLKFTQSAEPCLEAYASESKLISKDAFYEYFVNLQILHGIFSCSDIPNYVEYLRTQAEGKDVPATGLSVNPLMVKK